MDGKVIILLVTLAVAFGGPVPVPQETPALRTALASYVAWSGRVSRAFSRSSITSGRVRLMETSGQARHHALTAAIRTTAAHLNLNISAQNPRVKNKALQALRNSVLATTTNPDKVLGLLSTSSDFESHGARLSVWTDLFEEVSSRFRDLAENVEENDGLVDGEKLMEIFEVLYASEVAFDGLVSNFKRVEDKFDNAKTDNGSEIGINDETAGTRDHTPILARRKRGDDSMLPFYLGGGFIASLDRTDDGLEIGSNDETEAGTRDKSPILARRRRGANDWPMNLGGGFSDNSGSLSWRRDGTSAYLRPHYNMGLPPVTGATLGASHDFGRTTLSGSLSADYYSGIGAALGVEHRLNDHVSLTGALRGGYNHNTKGTDFGVGIGIAIKF